mmetsp:Transcript_40658/g.79201  ORF Transcript_40658/g.79201 Transcript_40658/m.79201 type:complete len:80 (-) Transcript_40658:596-835(-)
MCSQARRVFAGTLSARTRSHWYRKLAHKRSTQTSSQFDRMKDVYQKDVYQRNFMLVGSQSRIQMKQQCPLKKLHPGNSC